MTIPFRQKGYFFVDHSQPCGERASLAVVSGRIVFFEESNGKTLSPSGRVLVLRSEGSVACKSSNIRQVLLKFVFGLAFHLFLQTIGDVRHNRTHRRTSFNAREDSATIFRVCRSYRLSRRE